MKKNFEAQHMVVQTYDLLSPSLLAALACSVSGAQDTVIPETSRSPPTRSVAPTPIPPD